MPSNSILHSEVEKLGLSIAKELHGIIRRLSLEDETNSDNVLRTFARMCAEEYIGFHDDLMTAEEAQKFLGKKSIGAMKQACKTIKGQPSPLPFHKFQGQTYFSRRELTEFLLGQ